MPVSLTPEPGNEARPPLESDAVQQRLKEELQIGYDQLCESKGVRVNSKEDFMKLARTGRDSPT